MVESPVFSLIFDVDSPKKGMLDLFRNKRMTSSVEELREVHHFSETSTHSIFGDIDDVSTEFVSTEFQNQRKI
jgi:hypothetical protein